jgi:hypothetical protein
MQPTEPGWYWARYKHYQPEQWQVVYLEIGNANWPSDLVSMAGSESMLPPDSFTDWHGPLVPPDLKPFVEAGWVKSSLEDRVKAIEQWIDRRENHEQEQNEGR